MHLHKKGMIPWEGMGWVGGVLRVYPQPLEKCFDKNRKFSWEMHFWINFGQLLRLLQIFKKIPNFNGCVEQPKKFNRITHNVNILFTYVLKITQILIKTPFFMIFAYCYHKVNVICFALFQSDLLKELPV